MSTTSAPSAAAPADAAADLDPADSPVRGPSRRQQMMRFGPIAWLRRAWRRLISMRTALVLLFLLALAAVPGSLLPQRALNPTTTEKYIADHGEWGRLLDRLGGYAVFSSPWFAAIYLLLFISLIGCIVPRVRVHARALRAKPLPAPRNLSRLPESAQLAAQDERSPAQLAQDLQGALGRRWRTVVREESGGTVAISAEKGYLRETGNVLFHCALVAVLVCIAIGHLWGYTGTVLVTQGRGFCNTVLSYDSFKAGRFADSGEVAPFCVDSLDSFTANYREDGSASQFDAKITYSRGTDGAAQSYNLKVNSPLRIDGDRLYLLSHGYSATVTVTRPGGEARTVTAALVPQDANLSSEGAFKLQYGQPNDKGKHTDDIGLKAYLAPTAFEDGGIITSISPQLTNPVLALQAFTGDLGLSSGAPQSVYSLDLLAQENGDLVKVAAQNLAVGDTMALPDGTTIRFDEVLPWVSMQVSHDPTQTYLLGSVIALTTGLILSLSIRRRRVWIRIAAPASAGGAPADADADSEQQPTARTVVAVGGLARSDAGSFPDEFSALIARLREGAGLSPMATASSRAAAKEPTKQSSAPTGDDRPAKE